MLYIPVLQTANQKERNDPYRKSSDEMSRYALLDVIVIRCKMKQDRKYTSEKSTLMEYTYLANALFSMWYITLALIFTCIYWK